MKSIFTKSADFRQEYSATIVRVGGLKDIENSDNLKSAVVDGFPVVVNKNDVKDGDFMVYCKNETQLNHIFLSMNNMFGLSERALNANHDEIESLLREGREEEAKSKVGYFNKHGRVKMIRLRGCPSMGVLIRMESLVRWDPSLGSVRLEDYVEYDSDGNFIPFDFDTVNGKLFVKPYVPDTGKGKSVNGGGRRRERSADRYDRMVPGEFSFHYDTQQLNSNMWKIRPDDTVYVSVKVHGTSAVFGNVLVKRLTVGNLFRDFINKLLDKMIARTERRMETEQKATGSDCSDCADPAVFGGVPMNGVSKFEKRKTRLENLKFRKFDTKYDNVYSSRKVIKNRYINRLAGKGFYDSDIWGEYNELLKGMIPQGVTVYGEIAGYLTGTGKMIQKGYDYGCRPGENRLMIYRVTEKGPDGKIRELEIDEVISFTNRLVSENRTLGERIMPYPLLYHGTLRTLYHNIGTERHWNENVLEEMKSDRENFGMELDEPLCANRVPREGICLRIGNDPVSECFKLKTVVFSMRESALIDRGEVDMETENGYM